ncbi:hypothetical protein [Pelagicoccus mobilis]|uniref:Uncharacterized protein n=1 Tax=Pelagicoccus mobilis TaxID=415221 RepID=A0A934S4T0_9BACT|nr:hypothetical protein [Pelagicoccus mobilis]MBK1880741.1 hypothetical protein [Pelagicoccus mobilis]
MKIAVIALAIASMAFGLVAIEKNRAETTRLKALAELNQTPTEEPLNQKKSEKEDPKARYSTLLEEYWMLHEKMADDYKQRYEMELEERKRIRFLYPELELPPIKDYGLQFSRGSWIKLDPTVSDVSKLEYMVERLRRKYPNHAVVTTPGAAAPSVVTP